MAWVHPAKLPPTQTNKVASSNVPKSNSSWLMLFLGPHQGTAW